MNQPETTNEKLVAIMATVKSIKELLQKRLNNKIEALNSVSAAPLDNIPVEVQKMREEEASKIRAVMQ